MVVTDKIVVVNDIHVVAVFDILVVVVDRLVFEFVVVDFDEFLAYIVVVGDAVNNVVVANVDFEQHGAGVDFELVALAVETDTELDYKHFVLFLDIEVADGNVGREGFVEEAFVVEVCIDSPK